MALSGSISTGTWNGSSTSCSVIFNWTATQNIENNTSTISWSLKSSVSYGYVTISELRLKFDNEQIFYRNTSVQTDAYNGTTLASGTKTITHNTDGTKSFNVSVEAGIYEWAINKSGSGTITLNTIPRSSSIISASNVTLGNTCNVKWKPNSSSFKYKITFSLGSWSYTTDFISPSTTSEYTYTGYTIPNNETLLKQIPNSTTGTMSAVLTTYNSSGTQIGSASAAKTFTVTVPSTDAPSVGTITLDPVNINGQNILVQGKNKITVSVSGCSAGAGSSIKSYTFSGPGISYTGTSTSVTSSSTISNTGTLTYTVTVTDNRGRSASKTATITCYAYSAPYFKSFNAYRVASSSSSTASDSGIYARCAFEILYESVNNTNDVTVDIYYKKSTDNSYSSINAISNSKDTSGYKIISNIDISSTYTMYATISDNYGGSSSSTITTLFSESRIFNITADGTGFAIGKMAEVPSGYNGIFESRWPARFDDKCEIYGNLTIGSSNQNTTPENGITIHDVRNADITPDSFGDQNVNFYFDQIDGIGMSILHMKGLMGNYAAWELAGNAHNSLNDNTLKYRQGLGSTWEDWQTVITNKNINNYVNPDVYLPLDGSKALTGKLTLGSNLYYTNGSSGIDCKNSDIVNANGIYFGDVADSAGEAICFYRSDGYWDSLYAVNGALKFHPNRATSSALGGSTVYHNGNFKIETGVVTLNSSDDTSRAFSSSTGFAGAPNVLLTPITSATGVIAAKIRSVTTAGFVATIGGSVSGSHQFAYIAIYGNAI